MNNELKQKLRDALWDILDGNRPDSMGICAVLDNNYFKHDEYTKIMSYIKGCFLIWPYFSGDISYPIKGNNGDSANKSYYSFDYDLWEGEYGESRIQLVMFLLEQLGDPE